MKHFIGGQAVIEGVMIRGGDHYITSVRRPDNTIAVEEKQLHNGSLMKFCKKIPCARGVFVLFEAMKIGIQTLNFSANAIGEAEEKISGRELALSFFIAIVFAIGVFVALPYYLSGLIVSYEKSLMFNFIDGIIKILFFALYVLIISFFKDIRRVFGYHGAEHKVVNAYESGVELNLENINRFSTLHMRCGTNFIFLVLFISMFFFVWIPGTLPVFWKISMRVLLIPLIAGVSYEIIRLFNKFPDNIILKTLVAPGLLLQFITTRKPDDLQIEIALNSVNLILEKLNSTEKNKSNA